MTYHKDLSESNLHSIIRWEFADAAARAGVSGLVAADVGKVAWQKDNDTYWILKDHVGPAWNMNGGVLSDKVDKVTGVDEDIIWVSDGAGGLKPSISSVGDFETAGTAAIIQGNLDTHTGTTTGNPHSVTKTDVGLANVPNEDATDMDNWDQKGATEGQAPLWNNSESKWEPGDVGGGAWHFITSVTANNAATIDIENVFDDTYDNYILLCSGLYCSNPTQPLYVLFKQNGSYKSSNYIWYFVRYTVGTAGSGDVSVKILEELAASTKRASFTMNIPTPALENVKKYIYGTFICGNNPYSGFFGGAQDSEYPLTGLRFYLPSGNITGTFRLYGIANS